MKKTKKFILFLLSFAIIVSSLVFGRPITSKAATSFDTSQGEFVITSLENDFQDGKYRIRYKFEYKNVPVSVYRITLKNIRLENSAGKKVLSWNDIEMLEGGGEIEKNFKVDFSKLPSDTYYFKFTVEPYYAKDMAKSFKRKIEHSAGAITYSKSTYSTDTLGNKVLSVYFNVKMLNGKTPKLEVYDSNNNLVYTNNTKKTISSDNCNWYWKWDMTSSSTGLPLPDGTYSFKMTCGGKSCVKKLRISRN